mgnify:FL=1
MGSDQLESTSNPYRKALEWITHSDPLQFTPDVPNFLQRYLAAYLYFATSAGGEWKGGCNPPTAGQNDFCMSILQGNDAPVQTITLPAKRWLSKASECDWAGISCDEHEQFRTIKLGEFF